MDELRHVLDDLDEWFRSERPDLYPRFRPGLSLDEIREVEQRLVPYRLPADLVTLYGWHDGWAHYTDDGYVPLLPIFNSLAEAVAQYEMSMGVMEDIPEAWHPLWFPAFGDNVGMFVELQSAADGPVGFVWGYDSHAAEVPTEFDSVASLFRTALDGWRSGLLPRPTPLDPDFREFAAFVASHNPATRQPDGFHAAQRLSVFEPQDWPTSWRVAKGIEIPTAAEDADVITIAELLRDPWCRRPVRGTFKYSGGSVHVGYGTLTDETGSIKVMLDREKTQNYVLGKPGRVEMIVTPITEGTTVAEAHAAAEYENPHVEKIALRLMVDLSASFHAERVVPLRESEPQDA